MRWMIIWETVGDYLQKQKFSTSKRISLPNNRELFTSPHSCSLPQIPHKQMPISRLQRRKMRYQRYGGAATQMGAKYDSLLAISLCIYANRSAFFLSILQQIKDWLVWRLLKKETIAYCIHFLLVVSTTVSSKLYNTPSLSFVNESARPLRDTDSRPPTASQPA